MNLITVLPEVFDNFISGSLKTLPDGLDNYKLFLNIAAYEWLIANSEYTLRQLLDTFYTVQIRRSAQDSVTIQLTRVNEVIA